MQDPHRRVVVAVDMESYSKRNNVLQHRAQVAFKQIMEHACAEAGLDRNSWRIQPGGDGELAILPPQVSERAVVGRLAPVVDRLLREHNQGLAPEAKIRLRLAVHQGLVHLDGANGFPSDAVVHVCRLNDSPQLKQVLRRHRGANAALIVSESVYRDVIVHYQDLRPDYCRVSRPPRQIGFGTSVTRQPCRSAASTVCARSTAIVIGPTPPGTGVMRLARLAAAAAWTSPTLPAL